MVLGLVLGGCRSNGDATEAGRDETVAVAEKVEPEQPAAAVETVARWKDGDLTVDEFGVELERLPSRSRRAMTPQARAQFVENQILHELLFEEGEKRGLADDPEIKRQVESLHKRLVVQNLIRQLQEVPEITDEQVAEYYTSHRDRYSTTTIKARHIQVNDEALAKKLRADLEADPSQFEALAREHSLDASSARKGGDLGFFGHGRNPDFEEVAFALREPGQISEVVKTRFGYHVIQLVERREGKQKELDEVSEQIRTTLRQQAVQDRTQGYYEKLKKEANVQIDEAAVERVAASLPEPSPSKPASVHGH